MSAERNYPKWCCQECGLEIGYLGRFIEWLFGKGHRCNWRQP